MAEKRGQISVFIIIAILIVAAIVVIFLYREKVFDLGKEKIAPEVVPIHSFVEDCVKTTGENAIYYIGQTGGYFTIPNESIEYGIAYYYDKGKNYMPSKEKVEKELGDYMDYMLFFCTKLFSDFPDFNIEQNNSKTIARIEEGKVVFDVEYPITITKGEKTYFFKKFNGIEVPSRLDEVYALAYNITKEQMNSGDEICLSCIYESAEEKELYVEINKYDNETKIFTIRDEEIKILERDYRLYFANKYNAA